MERLTDMICSCIGDGTFNDIKVAKRKEDGCEYVFFNYDNLIYFQIIVPKQTIRGYTIYATPSIIIPKELIFNAILVANDFNDWVVGINSEIRENENDSNIVFKCTRFSHTEISEKEFESDFKRVLNFCWVNAPHIMDKIQSIGRIIDFS